jgi:transposase
MVDVTVHTSSQSRRSERLKFPVELERQIVEATVKPGASVALIAREHDLNGNLLLRWCRQYLVANSASPTLRCPIRQH